MNKDWIFFIGQNPILVNDLLRLFREHPRLHLHICIDETTISQSVQRLKPRLILLETDIFNSDYPQKLEAILTQKGSPSLLFLHRPGSVSENQLLQTAIQWGALDIINLQAGDDLQIIVQKIESILPFGRQALTVTRTKSLPVVYKEPSLGKKQTWRLILLGASTGGPEALSEILAQLPAHFAVPIVIVQHLTGNWTASLAERLDAVSLLKVREVNVSDKLESGVVLVVPGNQQIAFQKNGHLKLYPHPDLNRPSIDLALSSAAEAFGSQTLAVILTGMGNDGLEGARKIKQTGGKCLAEHASSCIVYGMPKAVVEAKLADKVLSLEKIASEIIQLTYGL